MTDIERISPKEASDRMEGGWRYVDVRTVEEYGAGHPRGALNVPVSHAGPSGMTPNPDFLRVMKSLFSKDAPIVVGCKSGGRSLRAAQALADDGFTRVADQRAGWDGARNAFGQVTEPGWSRAGLPSEEGQPVGLAWAELKLKV